MKENFTRKAMWACLVTAPANQVYSGICLVMSRKEIRGKSVPYAPGHTTSS